jgi:hypothetical protein
MSYNSLFTGNVVQPTDVAYASYALTSTTGSIQLEWPINGSITNYVAARVMQVSTTSTSYELWMPPANQASVGQDALIYNTGGVALTVKTFGGASTIVSIPSTGGVAQYIFITANPNTSGTWGVIAFGSTTSTANAASLAGYGLTTSASTLNVAHPASSIASGYSFSSADRAQTLYWQSGTGSATLPLAASLANNWFFLFRNSGTGTFTVNTTSSELVDGAASKSFNPGESAIIVCTGSQFFSVGYGRSNTFFFNVLALNLTGGNYTLSSSQAANVIQEFGGTLASNQTVTYPPVVNLYVVQNQTISNGYSLTLTTGIVGGSNAVIPANAVATVVCDGTNFYNANTTQAGSTTFSVVNGTAGGPSINFSNEASTGIFRPGTGQFGISILGTQKFWLDANGINSGTF